LRIGATANDITPLSFSWKKIPNQEVPGGLSCAETRRVRGISRGIPRAIARPVAQRRSRILVVCGTPLVPSTVGPARRNQHVIDELSRLYDVTVVAFGG
jgi:hypothetical protein